MFRSISMPVPPSVTAAYLPDVKTLLPDAYPAPVYCTYCMWGGSTTERWLIKRELYKGNKPESSETCIIRIDVRQLWVALVGILVQRQGGSNQALAGTFGMLGVGTACPLALGLLLRLRSLWSHYDPTRPFATKWYHKKLVLGGAQVLNFLLLAIQSKDKAFKISSNECGLRPLPQLKGREWLWKKDRGVWNQTHLECLTSCRYPSGFNIHWKFTSKFIWKHHCLKYVFHNRIKALVWLRLQLGNECVTLYNFLNISEPQTLDLKSKN